MNEEEAPTAVLPPPLGDAVAAVDSSQVVLRHHGFRNAKLVIRSSVYKSEADEDDEDDDGGGGGSKSDETLSDEVMDADRSAGDQDDNDDDNDGSKSPEESGESRSRPPDEEEAEKSESLPNSNNQLDKPAKLAFEGDFFPKGIACTANFGSLHIYAKPPAYESSTSIFQGIFGCIKPILSLWMSKSDKSRDGSSHDDFNIPFESITNLEWINSGSQGCVFKGLYKNEQVAIKKVKSKEETNIRHFKKLDHPNLVKLIGISINSVKFFCIVMEYCPHGQLYTYLNSLKPKSSCISATLFVDWSRQIAGGMQYLHSNKIIHRDLKSPNILISNNNMLKISDFGASRKINEKSTVMSFKGTVAWMAPEVIRNEACSEKVDVYSYGVVLWEMLTCEIPFKNLDQNSIMWGVGSNKLRLEIPERAPTGVKLLLQQCLNIKPRNRPSFNQIIKHLEIIEKLELKEDNIESYFAECSKELNAAGKPSHHDENIKFYNNTDDDLVKQRHEELRHAAEIRELYERKLEKANNLYFELSTVLLQLEEREREIIKREQAVQIYKKKVVKPLIKKEFQEKKSSMRLVNYLQSPPAPAATTTTTTTTTTVQPLAKRNSETTKPVKNQKGRPKLSISSISKKFNKMTTSNQDELSQETALTLRTLKSFSVSDLRFVEPLTTGIYKKATRENTTTTTNNNNNNATTRNLRPNSLLKIKVYSNIISQALNLNETFLRERQPQPQPPPQQPKQVNHFVINQNSTTNTADSPNPALVGEQAPPSPPPQLLQHPPSHLLKQRRTSL